ncbi:MAG: hypothetical protein IJA87_11180 [Clostridia bacterium]|nr:hypothetical protein [Clostridia bacterium]
MQKSNEGFGYAALRRKIYELKERYPFAGYSVCARSWSGRALFTLSLGNTRDPALYIAGMRSGSVAGTQVLLRLFERLCECVDTRSELAGIKLHDVLCEKGVIIIPCVNPDGMEIVLSGAVAAGSYAGLVERVCADTSLWQANARGVDLELNFSHGFTQTKRIAEGCGYTAPGAHFYAGKVPESEPETRALVRLCRSRDVRHSVILRQGTDSLYTPKAVCGAERVEMMCRILELSSGIDRPDDTPGALQKNSFAEWFVSSFRKPSFVIDSNDSYEELYLRIEEATVLSMVM